MNTNYLNKLEFNKVLLELSNFCCTFVAKDFALNLMPSNNKETVISLLSETQEGINLIYKNSTPPLSNISNIDMELKNIEINNTLSSKSLLNLANILNISGELKDYFNKDYINKNDFPILSNLFTKLYANRKITRKIFDCIIDIDTIADNASNKLQFIRRKQKNLEQDIRSKLNDIIHSSSYSKYIQEPIITIRNDRFVIPVKEEHRSQLRGFVHDISNAGSTVFIEPLSVFEMNNQLNQLKIEEEFEIERILQELTLLFYPYVEELRLDVILIGRIDFIFAKSKYARFQNSIIPTINNNKEINLIDARHPFIDKNKVVPISLKLNYKNSILLITGPNTGGKTVTLKTVGLLTCMSCSGLAIPCSENSSVYVFNQIFVDIGDDQSISDSLSTFSSHMLNIVDITNNANPDSLILVDELGSGTDPLEGANLAISILDFLRNLGTLTIATTHYQELKKYALVTDGFENASVEFDINTLSPTYKLLIGVPGKSNAFAISQKLGLKDDIINHAKSLLTTQDINIEELLKSIYDDKAIIQNQKEKLSQELSEIAILKKELQHDNKQLKQQEQNLLTNAKIEARNLLLDAKEEANKIIKEIKNSSNNKSLENLRNELNSKIKSISILSNTLDINSNTGLNNSDKLNISPEELEINQQVLISSLNKTGTVLSHASKSNEVQVQVGIMKMNININDLQKIENSSSFGKNFSNINKKNINNNKSSFGSQYTSISKTKNIRPEINVIGLNVEEAIFIVDKFLDDCSLSNLQTVRIVHGKGTGKLKNGIQQFLKTNPHVKSFRLGTFGEGEMGVTVVELK